MTACAWAPRMRADSSFSPYADKNLPADGQQFPGRRTAELQLRRPLLDKWMPPSGPSSARTLGLPWKARWRCPARAVTSVQSSHGEALAPAPPSWPRLVSGRPIQR